jgi:hypothetical protein
MIICMTPKTFYKTNSKAKVLEVCERAGTSLKNFKLIALYDGSCGGKLAVRLCDASDGEMSIREIITGESYG